MSLIVSSASAVYASLLVVGLLAFDDLLFFNNADA